MSRDEIHLQFYVLYFKSTCAGAGGMLRSLEPTWHLKQEFIVLSFIRILDCYHILRSRCMSYYCLLCAFTVSNSRVSDLTVQEYEDEVVAKQVKA